MSAIHEVLTDLDALFAEREIGWYVFGALAVVSYGRPRQTADIDVTVDISMQAVPELVADLVARGYSLAVDDIEAFALRTRLVPVVHDSSGMPVDIIIAGPGLEQEFLERVRSIDFGETRVPVISPEDLIVTKILAGRPKDLDDVRGILDGRRPLDMGRVRDLLMQLEHALDRSDLVSILGSLLPRTTKPGD